MTNSTNSESSTEELYPVSAFLQAMSDLNEKTKAGLPITNVSTEIVQAICILLGCHQKQPEFQMVLHYAERLYHENLPGEEAAGRSFSREYLVAVASMEKLLRESADPMEIIKAVLNGALKFYDADSVTIVEIDPETMSGSCFLEAFSSTSNPDSSHLVPININVQEYPALFHALLASNTIGLDINDDSLPEIEKNHLRTSNTSYAGIAPFHKRKSGFLLMRNPRTWKGYNELLQAAAFIIGSAMNELDLINDLAVAIDRDKELGKYDVVVNCFDKLSVRTFYGEKQDIKITTLPLRLLIYIVMNRHKVVTSQELIDHLWEDSEGLAGTGNNLRQQILKARRFMDNVFPESFIVIDADNRYCISSKVHLHLDTEAFHAYYERGKRARDTDEKYVNFSRAYSLYTGDLLKENLKDEWIAFRRTHYRIEFLDLIMDYLPVLLEKELYNDMYQVASRGLEYEPEHGSFHYYLILSMYYQGYVDIANKHLKTNSNYLTTLDRLSLQAILQKK